MGRAGGGEGERRDKKKIKNKLEIIINQSQGK